MEEEQKRKIRTIELDTVEDLGIIDLD